MKPKSIQQKSTFEKAMKLADKMAAKAQAYPMPTPPTQNYIESKIAEFDEKFDCKEIALVFDTIPENTYEASTEVKARDARPMIKSFLTSALVGLVELQKEKEEALSDALLDMYQQYCDDGHAFMSAGERASSVLERYDYADFDEAGRLLSGNTTKE